MAKLRQVILRVHNYQVTFKKLPMANVGNGQIGKNSSWRVWVIPVLELGAGFKKLELKQS